MSEEESKEEFDKWWKNQCTYTIISIEHPELDSAKNAWKYQQEKLDAKDKEIEALRKALIYIIDDDSGHDFYELDWIYEKHGLMKDGEKTKLLTGE